MNNKKNIIILLNICVFCIIFYVLFLFQQYFYLVYHDYLIPYIINGVSPEWGRIPSSFLYRLTKEVLPNLLNIHPQDSVSSIEAVIKSISFLAICTIALSGFYATAKEKFKIIRIESLFVLPCLFFLMGIPILWPSYHNMYFGRIEESVVYFEYFFCFIFYFAFFILFIYINLIQKNISLFSKVIFVVTSFLLGFWNELFNVATFFSLLIIFLIFLRYKKMIIKKENLLLILPFLFGIFCFYFFSNYMTGTKLVNYSYNWHNLFYNIKLNFIDFIKMYIQCMFITKVYFYLVIFFVIISLWKRRNYNINIILLTCLSILLGYLIMNLSLIIYRETPNLNYSGFLFQRELYQIIYVNILEFIIILLLGCYYFEFYFYRKKILIGIIIADLILLSIFIPHYRWIQEEKRDIKILAYNIEKDILVYSILGELAMLPASYLKEEKVFSREIFMFDDKYRFEREFSDYDIDKYSQLMKNRYFDSYCVLHSYYLTHEYNREFMGVVFVDDKIANIELKKRLKLLKIEDETKEDIIKKGISFNNLNKYRDYKLTLDDINNMEVNNENKDIILKAKAYLYYKNNDIQESLKLYLEYLKKKPDDIAALKNTADLYIKLCQFNKAESYYLKLNKIDNRNQTFLFQLLKIYYYYYKDYKKALEICNRMIELQDNMLNLYLNKAVIYLAMGNKDKTNEIIKYVEDKDINKLNEFLSINKINEKDEIYKNKFFVLLEPKF